MQLFAALQHYSWLEMAMLVKLLDSLNNWFENAERRRNEAFLAESKDIIELEHRIRQLESKVS